MEILTLSPEQQKLGCKKALLILVAFHHMENQEKRILYQKIFAIILAAITVSILMLVTYPVGSWRIFIIVLLVAVMIKLTIWPKPRTKVDIQYEKELKIEHELLRSHRIMRYFPLVIVGLIFGMMISAVTESNLFIVFFLLTIVATVFFFSFLGKVRGKKANDDRLAVATEVGLTYVSTGDVSSLHELFQSIAVERKKSTLSNIYLGNLSGYPARIFDFDYIWMKEARYSETFLEVTVSGNIPKMLILSKNDEFVGTIDPRSIFPAGLDTLEGDFSKYFTVYTEPGAGMEVRQILTPDVMASLIDDMTDVSFLIFDDKVYVTLANRVESDFLKEDFLVQLHKASLIVTKWIPTLSRMNASE